MKALGSSPSLCSLAGGDCFSVGRMPCVLFGAQAIGIRFIELLPPKANMRFISVMV